MDQEPLFLGLEIVIPEINLEEEQEEEGAATPRRLTLGGITWSRAELLRVRDDDMFTRDVRRRITPTVSPEPAPYHPEIYQSPLDSPSRVMASPKPGGQQDPLLCTVDALCARFREARARNAEIVVIDQDYANRNDLLSASYSRLESELSMFSAFAEIQHDAIHEMLADSFRMARERLQASVLERTPDRAEVSERVEAYRMFMLAGLQEFVPPEQVNTHVCPVCFVDEVNTTFYPCGHAFCQQCSVRVRVCPVCKAQVQGRNRLFFAI